MKSGSKASGSALGVAFGVFGLICSIAATALDNPEPGPPGAPLPGVKIGEPLAKPYFKGVRIVGHQPLGGRVGNEQLVWAGHCAYVSNDPIGFRHQGADLRSGVAVIDVRDPSAPRLVGYLNERGALGATETISSVDTPDRHLLAAGDYGGGNPDFAPNDPPVLDIYDVSDCTRPKLLTEYVWPENVHALDFSPNGQRLYGTTLTQPPLGTGGLQVLDVSDPVHPRYVGRFKVTGPDGKAWDFGVHDIAISADETRIYAGVIASLGGDLNEGKPVSLWTNFRKEFGGINNAGGIYIIDNSDLAKGRVNPKMRLIGTAQHAGWHAVSQAEIGGIPYLIGAGEEGRCPGAFPVITSIADETKPVRVGEFRLYPNEPGNCAKLVTSQITSSHFNDVDSPVDTKLGLFPFERGGGLWIADLRNPHKPVAIAYFRPGDSCTGHVRYLHRSGQIWLICDASGFWVLELDPKLRRRLWGPTMGRFGVDIEGR